MEGASRVAARGGLGARRFVGDLGRPRMNQDERLGRCGLWRRGSRHSPGHFGYRHAMAAESANAALVGHRRPFLAGIIPRLLLDTRGMAVLCLRLLPFLVVMLHGRGLDAAPMHARAAHQRRRGRQSLERNGDHDEPGKQKAKTTHKQTILSTVARYVC